MDEWYDANRRNWDERAPIHARSRTYDLQAYRDDPTHLSTIVAFDREVLGDLTGLDVVHLQCHIGTDTLSLARLGATVTGLDQSPASLGQARRLFADCATPGRFVQARVYDAVAALDARYDVVYTGVGAINWLPDIDRWGAVVAALLRPGGRLVMREGHPVLWSLDDRDPTDRTLRVAFPYFETAEPMAFDDTATYTDADADLSSTRTYEWNHGLGEIVTALLDHGMVLTGLREHRVLEWAMWPWMEPDGGRYRLPAGQRDLVPLMYTLTATRRDA